MLVAMTTPPAGQQPGPVYPAYQPPPPRHPDTVMVLVLGCLSIVVLPLIGPFAWVIVARVKREMAAAPGRWSSEDLVTVGYVLGIVGTVLCIIGAVFILGFLSVGLGVLSGVR